METANRKRYFFLIFCKKYCCLFSFSVFSVPSHRVEKQYFIMKIALFASGEGTNAENIIRYFSQSCEVVIPLVVINRKEAGARRRAESLGVTVEYIPKREWEDEGRVLSLLRSYGIEAIVLSGFLLHVPDYLLRAYPERIVNIHPALLPKHGGKGMYGMHVHEAVVADGDTESGITIHLVDDEYDHGRTLFQAKCSVLPGDTPEDVAAKVHKLEYEYFPKVIGEWVHEMSRTNPER